MSVGAVNKETGERIPTAGMPAIDSVLSGTSTNPVQNRVVKAALDDKADTDIVASDFSTSASYTAGDYCIYEGKFYKFKNNHSGAWSAADVDEIKIAGELSSLMSGLTDLTNVRLIGNDVFTFESGIALDVNGGSVLNTRGGWFYGRLKFSGLLTIPSSGTVKIGTLSNAYRPLVNARVPMYLNTPSGALTFAIFIIMTTGYTAVIGAPGTYGKNTGEGSDSWDTEDGVTILHPIAFS